ncbi:MAG: ferritin [Deltaproteobacteria bacterium]|nr:ferritin [Deltaproteobacteria bacterium]MCX7953189.1 ferritin [Deltaproteobacteria bacterium]
MAVLVDSDITKGLNFQFCKELQASYNYYCASSWFGLKGFSGFQHWFLKQSKEELEHARKLYDFLMARDIKLIPADLVAGRTEFATVSEVFKWGLELEIQVEKDYNDLCRLCLEKKDLTTYQFLEWFLNEQVEEIETFKNFLDNVVDLEGDPSALRLFDNELLEKLKSS